MNNLLEDNLNNSDRFMSLLLDFGTLPKLNRRQTLMEVTGYPHYENVCSNMLSFYFNPAAEHGLKDLLLNAFLLTADKINDRSLSNVEVYREYPSLNGRIDLVITSDFLTICIENKIYHWLANDLEDYSHSIDQLSKNKATLKVVLSLNPVNDSNSLAKLRASSFVNCTYGQLWQEVRKLLGNYIAGADLKWVTYLLDFMETTNNLSGESMELKKTDHFFIDNSETIKTMLAERDAFLGRLTKKIEALAELMKATNEVSLLDVPPYKHSSDRLVIDFKEFADNYWVSFDLFLTPSGWDLQLFGRNRQSQDYLIKLINQPMMLAKFSCVTNKEKRYSVQRWSVTDDLGDIRDALCSWIVAVNEAAKTVANLIPSE